MCGTQPVCLKKITPAVQSQKIFVVHHNNYNNPEETSGTQLESGICKSANVDFGAVQIGVNVELGAV